MSDYTVIVHEETVQVGVTEFVVDVIEIGIQGPPGASVGSLAWGDITGKPLTFAPITFEFNQPTPSGEWIINHNLGYKPTAITVEDLLGDDVDGFDVLASSSLTQTRLLFSPALSGKARLI